MKTQKKINLSGALRTAPILALAGLLSIAAQAGEIAANPKLSELRPGTSFTVKKTIDFSQCPQSKVVPGQSSLAFFKGTLSCDPHDLRGVVGMNCSLLGKTSQVLKKGSRYTLSSVHESPFSMELRLIGPGDQMEVLSCQRAAMSPRAESSLTLTDLKQSLGGYFEVNHRSAGAHAKSESAGSHGAKAKILSESETQSAVQIDSSSAGKVR